MDPDAESQFNVSSRAKVSKTIRELSAESARKVGDKNDLWLSAASHVSSISLRFLRSSAGDPVEPFEWDMHDLWHLYIHASMNINDQCAEQDRLVVQILQMRELGVLVRKGENDDTTEEARTSGGRIWEDLPFLVGDMTQFWLHHSGELGQPIVRISLRFWRSYARWEWVGTSFAALLSSSCAIHWSRVNLSVLQRLTTRSLVKIPALSTCFPRPTPGSFTLAKRSFVCQTNQSTSSLPRSEWLVDWQGLREGSLRMAVSAPNAGCFGSRDLREIASDKYNEGHGHEAREFARGMLGSMTTLVCESDSAMKHELARQCKLPVEDFE